jgi:hypothetical protein
MQAFFERGTRHDDPRLAQHSAPAKLRVLHVQDRFTSDGLLLIDGLSCDINVGPRNTPLPGRLLQSLDDAADIPVFSPGS